MISGLADSLWLARLPFPRSGELRECELAQAGELNLFGWLPSLRLERMWEQGAPPGVLVGAFASYEGAAQVGSEGRTVAIVEVTQGTLPLLGVPALAGRLLERSDFMPQSSLPVVLSLPLARDGFGSAQNAIGREVRVMGLPGRVIGVMPAGFHVPLSLENGEQRPEAWLPISALHASERMASDMNVDVLLRVPGGMPDSYVMSILDQITSRVPGSKDFHVLVSDVRRVAARDLRAPLTGALYAEAVLYLLGILSCVIFLAVRARRAELQTKMRLALGAPPWTLRLGPMAEGAVLGFSAGVLGAWGAWMLMRGAAHLLAPMVVPGTEFRSLPAAVIALAAGLFGAIAAGGVVAAFEVARVGRRLCPLAASAATPRLPWFRWTLAVELGAAVWLAAGFLLFARTYTRMAAAQSGYSSGSVLAAVLVLPPGTCERSTCEYLLASGLYRRISAIPQFSRVAVTGGVPAVGGSGREVWVPGQTHRVGVSFWPYLGDFFGALGMRAVRGSLPDPGEAGVVLDQAAAKKFFGRADPVGRVLVWGSKPGQSGTIVAEVPDLPEVYGVDMGQIRLIAPAHVYVPLALAPTRSLRVVAAFRGDPGTALKLVDRAVSEQDGTVAFETRTMVQWAGARLARARLLAALLAALGAAALVVCLLGVFAVAAYTSSAREPEIAIRVALGARPRAVAQIVLRPVLVAAALGVSAGLVIVFASLRLIAGLVLSTAFATLSDATLAAAAVCAAALTAAALPCWRATRTDPSTVLRGE